MRTSTGSENTRDRRRRTVLIAAGGTGGHIFPGVAVAQELLRRDPAQRVVFVGTRRGLETRLVPRKLLEVVSRLQLKTGKRVTIDEAIQELMNHAKQ